MTILTHLGTFVLGAIFALELVRRQPIRKPTVNEFHAASRPAEPKLDGVTDDNPTEDAKERRQQARGFFS